MSNNDSLDEETKRILAEVEPDAQSGSNDSKVSNSKKKTYNDEGYDDKGIVSTDVKWEENNEDDDDSQW